MYNIAVVVASHEKNLELAQQISAEVNSHQMKSKIFNLFDYDLPLYDPKSEESMDNKLITPLFNVLQQSQAMVFVAPEYNGCVPPVFNNSIAWISRYSKQWREVFNGKPAVIATHSGGGGAYVLMHMRMQLSYIGMNVIGRQLLTNSDKPLNQKSLTAVVEQLSMSL